MAKNTTKEIKTNAMRILDKHHIVYDVLQYECEEFMDGIHTAEKTGAPVEVNSIMSLFYLLQKKFI